MFIHKYNSPLGKITLASDGEKLSGLWFDGQKYFGDTLGKEKPTSKKLAIFDDAKKWLDIYFSGKAPDFTPPLEISGSDFRQAIYKILLAIPFGQVMTYSEIAKAIAKQKGIATMSAQAVGGAVAHNAISIIIPCHRVVGTNGSLTGYSGGFERKKKLLSLEGVDTSKFFVPKL